MFVTHTEQKEDKEKGLAAIPAGLLLPNRADAEALVAAGLADERVVRCVKSHYVNEKKTVVYGERQVIENVDHALRALGATPPLAVLEPSLGDKVKIIGVVAAEKFHPIEMFNPFPPKKKKKAGKKPSEETPAAPAATDSGGAGNDTPA